MSAEMASMAGMAVALGITPEQVLSIVFGNLTTIILAVGMVMVYFLIAVAVIRQKMREKT